MAGATRRSKPLKAKSTIGDITGITISGQATGDILVSNASNEWLNTQALTGTYTITAATIAALTATALTVTNDLGVGGNTSITGTLSAGGASTLTGAASLLSTLAVTGAATLSSTLALAGTLSGAGFSMSGSGTIAQNLTVTGTATIGTLVLADASFSGNVDIAGYLQVAGATVLNDDLTVNANLSAGAIAGTSLSTGGLISGAGALNIAKIGWSAVGNDVTALLTSAAGTYTVSGVQTDLAVQAMLVLNPDAHHVFGGIDGLIIPVGTTGEEPTGANGMLRYDSTTHAFRGYVNGAWADLGGGGGATDLDSLTDVTLTTPATGAVLYKSAGDWIDTPAITIDPAAGLHFYTNALEVLHTDTQNIGIHTNGTLTDPWVGFYHGAGEGTRQGFLQMGQGSTTMRWNSEITSAVMRMNGFNSADSSKAVFSGDPDGASTLYWQGIDALATVARGVVITDTSGDIPLITLQQDGGTDTCIIGHIADNSSIGIDSLVNGSVFAFRGKDTGGTLRNLIVARPDTSIDLYYNGTLAFKAISGTIQTGTHTGIGAETITGYITINDLGGTSRKLAVVS
jgi:hypothetical protein